MARPALLIWNPASGGGRRWGARVGEIVATLRDAGFEVEVKATTEPGHASVLASEGAGGPDAASGCEVVFGLGGDGTLREIAAGLIGSDVPIALLPGGTTNVLALALGVPANPLRAASLYAESEVRAFDVGLIRMAGGDTDATAIDVPFLMMLSIGVDSEVLRRASQSSKKRFGRLAVAAQALGALRAWDAPARTVVAGDRRVAGSFVVASNIRYYGGPFEVTPRADPLDGELDFAVFSGSGKLALLELALDVVTGTHLTRPDFTTWKGQSARIEGDGEVWAQIDGDPLRLALPIEIEVAPDRLNILVPTTTSEARR